MKSLLLVLIPTLIAGSQYVPLSGILPGIVQGSSSSSLQIQLFYDPMCPDSADFDKTWLSVEQNINADPSLKDKVKFRYVAFGLPYHFTAHRIVQALLYIREKNGDKTSLAALRYFFENQKLYDQTAILKLTIIQFMEKVAKDLSNKFSVDYAGLLASMMNESIYSSKARYQIKFILGILGQCGAPRVLMNWNQIDNGTNFSVSQWIQFLKKYV